MPFWVKLALGDEKTARRRPRRKSRRVRRLESLERRQMMAADVGFQIEMPPQMEEPSDALRMEIVEIAAQPTVAIGGWGMAQYQYGFEVSHHANAEGVEHASEQFEASGTMLKGTSMQADAPVEGTADAQPELGNLAVEQPGEAILIGLLLPAIQKVRMDDGLAFAEDFAMDAPDGEKIEEALTSEEDENVVRADDVYIEGKIITAENYESALLRPDEVDAVLELSE